MSNIILLTIGIFLALVYVLIGLFISGAADAYSYDNDNRPSSICVFLWPMLLVAAICLIFIEKSYELGKKLADKVKR